MKTRLALLVIVVLCSAPPFYLGAQPSTGVKPPTQYTFRIVHVYPHDPNAFTEGLVYRHQYLYEGTGRNGQSSIRKVRLETGKVLNRVDLPAEYFGEGVALLKNEILQLTLLSQTGFVYDPATLKLVRRFSYRGEAWGLTTDGNELFMSDGTAEIHVLDPTMAQERRCIRVHDGDTPITRLNELEFVKGEILANIWYSDRIARISPKDGRVTGWIDLASLYPAHQKLGPEAVLNGIAYDPVGERLFVTGKLWPQLFEIRLVPQSIR